jgi:hypothetical protein
MPCQERFATLAITSLDPERACDKRNVQQATHDQLLTLQGQSGAKQAILRGSNLHPPRQQLGGRQGVCPPTRSMTAAVMRNAVKADEPSRPTTCNATYAYARHSPARSVMGNE